MTVENVKKMLKFFGLEFQGNTGNLFKIKLPSKIDDDTEVYSIHIPLLTKRNTLSYNNIDEISNPILAVLPKQLEKNQVLTPIEAWYLMKRRPSDWDKFMRVAYGNWLSEQKTLIAGFVKNIDEAWAARASEVIEVELFRGLTQDINRSKENGFNGFNATNGSIQNFLSKYCVFGVVPTNALQGRIVFNSEIPENATSPGNIIDLSSCPQDTDATERMHVFHGVQVNSENKLVRTKKFSTGSYVLNAVPLRKFINEKRMVVQRASDQALPLRDKQKAIVRNIGATQIPGINAISLRSDKVPLDSFIISKSFAEKLWASRFVRKTYRLPDNTNVMNMFTPISEEEINVSIAMGVQPPRIRPGHALFRYARHELGQAITKTNADGKALSLGEHIQSVMLEDKKTLEVTTKEFLTPTATSTTKGWDRTPCTVHQIEGIQLIDLKIGSKLIDQFGNKGTVCEIRADEDMPVVHIDEEFGYPVALMYNPAIYKRKVAFSYKVAGLLGLQEYMRDDIPDNQKRVILDPNATASEVLQMVKDRGTKRFYTVTEGEETYLSGKVSLQFFMHLDQDPERKFRYSTDERCRLTLIDREYLKKMGFNIKSNFNKPNQIGKAVGIEASLKDDMPEFKGIPVTHDNFGETFRISKRFNRAYLKTDIGTLTSSAVEDTVADPRLKTMTSYVQTDVGNIYAPANMFAALVNHKNSMILPSELVTLNAILSEQISVNWLRSEVESTKRGERGKRIEDLPRLEMKVKLGEKKRNNLIDQYYSKLMGRFANEISEAYRYRLPGIFGVASANNNLPMNTVGIPRFVWNRLKKFSNTHGVFRRHPIHRIYNCIPVNLVPTDGYTIQVNEQLMRLSDGRKEIAVNKLRD